MATTCIDIPMMNPIGYMDSVFSYKNGTPRQPSLCPYARGTLTIDKSLFTNPEHSLEDLEEFSHVWVIFVFHKNNNKFTKAKVKPPRLNGRRVGVFSTRSPYRPNPIGLTLAKLDKILGSTVYLSGIDLLDGTPVLDIKPYIPSYDVPNNNPKSADYNSDLDNCCGANQGLDESHSVTNSRSNTLNKELPCINTDSSKPENETPSTISTGNAGENDKSLKTWNWESDCMESGLMKDISEHFDDETMIHKTEEYSQPNSPTVVNTKTADWLQSPPIDKLTVRFTNTAMQQLNQYSASSNCEKFCLKYLESSDEVLKAINDILCQDPRSVYRRNHCVDNLYYFVVDTVHVTTWFDKHVAEVVRIQPVSDAEHLRNQ